MKDFITESELKTTADRYSLPYHPQLIPALLILAHAESNELKKILPILNHRLQKLVATTEPVIGSTHTRLTLQLAAAFISFLELSLFEQGENSDPVPEKVKRLNQLIIEGGGILMEASLASREPEGNG